MSIRTRVRGLEFDVRVGPSGSTAVEAVALPGSPLTFDVLDLGDGQLVVDAGGRRHRAEVVRVGSDCWVHVDGRAYLVHIADHSTGRARARAHVHDVLAAPMHATVVRLEVAVGDEVSEGQVLLVLEAMKMQMPMKAPHRAIVRAITCAVGDLVPPHVALVELDEIDEIVS